MDDDRGFTGLVHLLPTTFGTDEGPHEEGRDIRRAIECLNAYSAELEKEEEGTNAHGNSNIKVFDGDSLTTTQKRAVLDCFAHLFELYLTFDGKIIEHGAKISEIEKGYMAAFPSGNDRDCMPFVFHIMGIFDPLDDILEPEVREVIEPEDTPLNNLRKAFRDNTFTMLREILCSDNRDTPTQSKICDVYTCTICDEKNDTPIPKRCDCGCIVCDTCLWKGWNHMWYAKYVMLLRPAYLDEDIDIGFKRILFRYENSLRLLQDIYALMHIRNSKIDTDIARMFVQTTVNSFAFLISHGKYGVTQEQKQPVYIFQCPTCARQFFDIRPILDQPKPEVPFADYDQAMRFFATNPLMDGVMTKFIQSPDNMNNLPTSLERYDSYEQLARKAYEPYRSDARIKSEYASLSRTTIDIMENQPVSPTDFLSQFEEPETEKTERKLRRYHKSAYASILKDALTDNSRTAGIVENFGIRILCANRSGDFEDHTDWFKKNLNTLNRFVRIAVLCAMMLEPVKVFIDMRSCNFSNRLNFIATENINLVFSKRSRRIESKLEKIAIYEAISKLRREMTEQIKQNIRNYWLSQLEEEVSFYFEGGFFLPVIQNIYTLTVLNQLDEKGFAYLKESTLKAIDSYRMTFSVYDRIQKRSQEMITPENKNYIKTFPPIDTIKVDTLCNGFVKLINEFDESLGTFPMTLALILTRLNACGIRDMVDRTLYKDRSHQYSDNSNNSPVDLLSPFEEILKWFETIPKRNKRVVSLRNMIPNRPWRGGDDSQRKSTLYLAATETRSSGSSFSVAFLVSLAVVAASAIVGSLAP